MTNYMHMRCLHLLSRNTIHHLCRSHSYFQLFRAYHYRFLIPCKTKLYSDHVSIQTNQIYLFIWLKTEHCIVNQMGLGILDIFRMLDNSFYDSRKVKGVSFTPFICSIANACCNVVLRKILMRSKSGTNPMNWF